jgi:hypothetical protein
LTVLDVYPDFAVRQAEGWDLFECDGIEHAPYELEKVDEAAKFDGDIDVWRHVLGQACAGRPTHLRALAFLALYSPEELVGIWYSLFFGEYRTYLQPRGR